MWNKLSLHEYGNNPHNRFSWGVLVGYGDYGKTLLYMGGDGTEPDHIATDDLLPMDYQEEETYCHGWLFIGEKQESINLATIFRERILLICTNKWAAIGTTTMAWI